MNNNLLYNIKKKIYKNSQLIRDKQISIKKFLNKKKKMQFGGTEDLIIIYKKYEYKYIKALDDNYYILYSKDDIDCVTIIIFPEDENAEIHGIGNYKSCIEDSNKSVGSTLLKITIKMLKKYKDKFKINKIILTDNSLKKCGKVNIKLAHMLFLLNGNTWYGKYDFRPIDNATYEYNEILNEQYNNNQSIIENINIKEANIIKYIKLTKNKGLISATNQIIEKEPNMLLKIFLQNILKEFDKTCELFYLFYERLYVDIGLINFHRLLFGLTI